MLMSGVSGRIPCYDEAEAARYLEYRLEEYEELEAAAQLLLLSRRRKTSSARLAGYRRVRLGRASSLSRSQSSPFMSTTSSARRLHVTKNRG
jgi:hypothetical protein